MKNIKLFFRNQPPGRLIASGFALVILLGAFLLLLPVSIKDGAEVSVEALIEAGIVKNPRDGVKILGNGELTKKLNVKANAFSASAKEKIEALGGKAEVI